MDYLIDKSQCVRLQPFPGVEMFIAESPQMTLSLVEMAPGAVIPEHSHPHEQVGYMIEGEAEFLIAGQRRRVVAGQMWRLPGGVPHEVVTGESAMRAIDIFYPVREDMRHEWKADRG